nr:MAG TPA: hypothetical protein [Caudoviricetes sp.]
MGVKMGTKKAPCGASTRKNAFSVKKNHHALAWSSPW